MKIKFIAPREGAPEKLLANAEISDFIKGAPNIKMVDIAIWIGQDEESGEPKPWVAFPGRQYKDRAGKTKTARFIRPVGEEWGDMNKLQDYIAREYEKWAEQQTAQAAADDGNAQSDDNPFA